MERVLARFEGDVQLVLYPFARNPTSKVATQAALCAGEQGKFWEFHRMLYARQEQWRRLPDPRQRLEEFARDVGVDTAALDSCVRSGRMEKLINADMAYGGSLGVRSTPTVFINDRRIVGAQPEGDFVRTIRQVLDRARRQTR
jgi:protein-disulfide isomerase